MPLRKSLIPSMCIVLGLCILCWGEVNLFFPTQIEAQTSHFLCRDLSLDNLRQAGIVDIKQVVYPNPAECMYISPADYMTVTVLRNPLRSTVIRGLRLFRMDGSPMYILQRGLRCDAYFLLENIIITTETSYCGVTASLMAYIEQHKL